MKGKLYSGTYRQGSPVILVNWPRLISTASPSSTLDNETRNSVLPSRLDFFCTLPVVGSTTAGCSVLAVQQAKTFGSRLRFSLLYYTTNRPNAYCFCYVNQLLAKLATPLPTSLSHDNFGLLRYATFRSTLRDHECPFLPAVLPLRSPCYFVPLCI